MNAIVIEFFFKKSYPQGEDKWMTCSDVNQAMLLRNYAYTTFQSTGSVDDWRLYFRYWNKAKKIIRKERTKYFVNMFVGMDPSTMWRMLGRLGFTKGNDSPFSFGVEEVNDNFVNVPNCDLPVDSES
uniref:Uncharacterized protein n=1 Tax=Glossina pallidipes TaxID=7398 RepID=A0A1B0AJC6_GLOPL